MNEIMIYFLVDIIEEILIEFENSGLLVGKDIMKLLVEYKGKLYRIYLKEVVKQKVGVGNYNVLRVNIFYLIEL